MRAYTDLEEEEQHVAAVRTSERAGISARDVGRAAAARQLLLCRSTAVPSTRARPSSFSRTSVADGSPFLPPTSLRLISPPADTSVR